MTRSWTLDLASAGKAKPPAARPIAGPRQNVVQFEGREDDTLVLAGLDQTPTRVFADLVARAMIHADGVTEYRVRQVGAASLEVELEPGDPWVRAGVRTELDLLWSRLRVRAPEVCFMPYRAAVGTKLRRVERAWTGDADEAL